MYRGAPPTRVHAFVCERVVVVLRSIACLFRAFRVLCLGRVRAQFIVFQLRDPRPLDRKTVQMFERVMLADNECNHFMCSHGAVKPDEECADAVNGKFMSLPASGASKYYVGAMNLFGDLGGFDLLVSRLQQRVCARASPARAPSE